MALDFAYAVARTRVLETRLLDKDRLDRMIAAPNAGEALKVLAETAYGSIASQINAEEYEIMINAHLKDAYDLMRSVCPVHQVVDVLALKYDFHNMKVLLKDIYLKQHDDDLLINLGVVELDKLKIFIQEEDYGDMPVILKGSLLKAKAAFEVSQDPQDIDIILDNCYYEAVYGIADQIHSGFIKEFFRRQADMINIKTFMRVRKMGRDSRFLLKALLPGGHLDKSWFAELIEMPLSMLATRLKFTFYEALSDAVMDFEHSGHLAFCEKAIDNELLTYVRDNRSDPFGPAAIVGYLWAVENETRIIRIIMVGKINDMPSDAIRQRVREVY